MNTNDLVVNSIQSMNRYDETLRSLMGDRCVSISKLSSFVFHLRLDLFGIHLENSEVNRLKVVMETMKHQQASCQSLKWQQIRQTSIRISMNEYWTNRKESSVDEHCLDSTYWSLIKSDDNSLWNVTRTIRKGELNIYYENESIEQLEHDLDVFANRLNLPPLNLFEDNYSPYRSHFHRPYHYHYHWDRDFYFLFYWESTSKKEEND